MVIFDRKIICSRFIGTGRYVPRAVFVDLEPSVIGKKIALE